MCTSVLEGWIWDSSTHSAPQKVNSKLNFRSAAYLWKDPFSDSNFCMQVGKQNELCRILQNISILQSCSWFALPSWESNNYVLFRKICKKFFCWVVSNIKHIPYHLYLPFNFAISLWLGKSQYLRAQRRSCSVHVSGLIVMPRFILDFSLPWGQTGRKTIFNITISFPEAIILEERYRQLMVVML